MVPVGNNVEKSARLLALLVPQVFPPVTEMDPLLKGTGNVTERLVVPWPLLMTAPDGTVQL